MKSYIATIIAAGTPSYRRFDVTDRPHALKEARAQARREGVRPDRITAARERTFWKRLP